MRVVEQQSSARSGHSLPGCESGPALHIQDHISSFLPRQPAAFSEDTSAQGLCQGELKSSQGSWERDEQDPLEAFPVGVDESGGV